jgi:hypothetical protein
VHAIEDLRDWVDVGDSQDEVLRFIEAAVVRFLERETNRLFPCPRERATEVLDGPGYHSGRLSGLGRGPQQWVLLREPPISQLDGAFSIVAGSDLVTAATDADFGEPDLSGQLSAAPASAVRFAGGSAYLLEALVDESTLRLTEPAGETLDGVAAEAPLVSIELRDEGDGEDGWQAADPRDFEVDGRRVYSPGVDLPTGRRTVRATYRRGFEEGDAPADVSHLVLDMVKASYMGRRRRGIARSVSIDGAFRVDYAKLGEAADEFKDRVRALRRPLGFA